ncbi:transposase [Trichonephila clavipes]|nr:transposase [Trichonephila clavipes]
MDRISICEALAKRNEIDPFLKLMVTGDEKCDNIVRKQSWSKRVEAAQMVTKPELTARKRLSETARIGQQKRCCVPSGQRPATHARSDSPEYLGAWLGEVLMHAPYSPDLAPRDYHLSMALQNFWSDKKLGSREDCENRLLEFLSNKDEDFFERGIMKLP